MNDYAFGNHLRDKREKLGLTQAQLAEKLGVSAKAVSKWETGAAKPTTNTLKKLALLFECSLEDLFQMTRKSPKITKIVITGGPCAGKSTALSWIQNAFTKKGYAVLFVPETATELISGGVAPWTLRSNEDYQKCQMELQAQKERIFEQAAQAMDKEKVLLVCDRGQLDNKAYMNDFEFAAVLQALNQTEVQLRDRYDAVFHLVSAAKGAEDYYTTQNNTARTETPQQAAKLDDQLIAAWTGHPHLRIIDNATNFEDKMKRLIKEISSFLGEPEPYEIERKFLIQYPDLNQLKKLPQCRQVEMIQTYLKSSPNEEIRVRQRGEKGSYIYTKTIKKTLSPLKRVEIERRLCQEEYLRLLMEADPQKRPIRKTRYCLTYENQYFEIDIYPFWKDQAILEIELSDEKQAIHFPKDIKILKEVTADENYKNAALANF